MDVHCRIAAAVDLADHWPIRTTLHYTTGKKFWDVGLDWRWRDEDITNCLYGGDGHDYHRIVQDVVLGIGGVNLVNELGLNPEVYHLNEGH